MTRYLSGFDVGSLFFPPAVFRPPMLIPPLVTPISRFIAIELRGIFFWDRCSFSSCFISVDILTLWYRAFCLFGAGIMVFLLVVVEWDGSDTDEGSIFGMFVGKCVFRKLG